MPDVVLCQWTEHNNFVQPVQEFRTEVRPQILVYSLLRALADSAVRLDAVQQILGADVGCHNQDGVLKIHRPALRIRDTAVIQNLQQYVKHIRMRFFNLIKEHDAVRFSADCLCQLSAFIIADISRRSSDQPGDRILLHVLTHINTDHVVLIVEQLFRKCLCQLRFADAGGTQKQERADGPGGILDTRFGTDNGIRNLFHSLVLADNPFVQLFIQVKNFCFLTLCQLGNRNTGQTRHDSGDLILIHAFMNQLKIRLPYALLLVRQLFLQPGQLAVAEFRQRGVIISSLCGLDLLVTLKNLLTQL